MAHDCKINQYELDTDGALIEEKNKNTKEKQNKINNTKANPNMTNNTFMDSENEELLHRCKLLGQCKRHGYVGKLR